MTYKGLPGPHICDFWIARASAANYDDGSTFQIGRIDMVANTGTYVDVPVPPLRRRRRILSELALDVARRPAGDRRPPAVGERDGDRRRQHSMGSTWAASAVLVHTGWDRHWRQRRLLRRSSLPHRRGGRLADRRAARRWSASTATISTTCGSATRPVHTGLLGAGIPICEHMTGPRRPARRRLPLLRGAAQGEGHGDLPGARLRRARLSERFLQPIGDDRAVEVVDAAMFDRKAELRIVDARARARRRSRRRPAGG